ncbi:MAG: enoyl-CoA hydratase/isomerase family protein [Chloroflexi bacterium]|nr:enoyl-CoA hydratase/isomerase family protein [Chloroflexota bacterium]
MPPTVDYEVRDNVAWITLNRPDKLNAIDSSMRSELFPIMQELKYSDALWMAVITGNGRAFSVGHDLVEMTTAGSHYPTTDDLYLFQLGIYKPIIAAINGFCLAQGAGLALCSDIRIASDQARFGWPQVKRGIGSVSGPCLLAHRVPLNIALEFLFTGEFIDAQEAKRLNLVNYVVPHAQLMEKTEEFVSRIRGNAPLAARAMKETTVRGQGMTIEDRVRLARLTNNAILQTADAQEGLLAFREKRAPVWQGR